MSGNGNGAAGNGAAGNGAAGKGAAGNGAGSPVNGKKAIEVDNKNLEDAIKTFKQDASKENVVALMAAMRTARLLLPAKFPSDLSDEIREMIRKRVQIPKEKMPPLHPVLEQTQKGELFVAAYTSKEHITNPQDYPVIINTNFEQLARIAADKKLKTEGIIMNPRTDKLTLHPQFIDAMGRMNDKMNGSGDTVKKVQLTRAQFEAFARKNVEQVLLPQAAFEDSSSFMEQLDNMRDALIFGFYQKPYGDKIPSPYRQEDFDVMILDVRDDCRIASIMVPEPKGVDGCYALCITYNPQTEALRYFMFEKKQADPVAMVAEILKDGKLSLIGEAPAQGSEMSFVLDTIG